MKLTKTFHKTLTAYRSNYRYIFNCGSSRSSKTYSILQLLYLLAKNGKSRVIHVVSHSTPHLKDGAIADFEKILMGEGENMDQIRTQNPHTYKIGKSTIKFIGFDKLGKALGAARDILFINEMNKMQFQIVHQLMQRTRETIFGDFNPSAEFWVYTEGYEQRDDTIFIHSTFIDNIENLTEGQINDFKRAKEKHDEAVLRGETNYWYNWWRVYGLGLKGAIEGQIFTYWREGDFDESLPIMYGMDWGMSDPQTLVKVAIDWKNKKLYAKELHYGAIRSVGEVKQMLGKFVKKTDLIIADRHPGNAELKDHFNVEPAKKPPGSIIKGIQLMQDFELIITPESYNLKRELQSYVWLDRKGDVPIDKDNHAIDAIRICLTYFHYMR